MSGKQDHEKIVQFYKHTIDEESIAEMVKTARSMFITTGSRTGEFEKEFSAYLGVEHSVGMMSCTHALHLAYLALGIGEGDEVIVPAFSFAATVTTVLHAGATPVFADVDKETGNIDPDKVLHLIGPKTKAICPVHIYGVMAPMDRLKEIAVTNNLKIVEDAAHCVEGTGPGFRPGSHSDASCFSFYATKNITSGEGGMLSTNSPEVADRARILRTHGMSKNAAMRYAAKFSHYDILDLGYKCNLTDLQSALLIPQLRKIEVLLEKRKRIAEKYTAAFKKIDGLTVPPIPNGYKSAYHLYTIRVPNEDLRDKFLNAVIDNGVNCAVHFRPFSDLSYFKERFRLRSDDHPNATAIGKTTLTLPLYPSLQEYESDRVIEVVEKIAKQLL